MKNDCNVVRDLMPLVIDGAASESSTELVTQHVAECPPCSQVYEELHAEIHAEKQAREQAEFEQAARKMHRHRKIKKLLTILAPILLCVLALAGCGLLVHKMHTTYVLKGVDEFNVQLVQIKGTDQVVMIFTQVDSNGHGVFYDRSEDGVRFLVRASTRQLKLPGDANGTESFMQYMHQCRLVDGHIQEEYQGTRTVLEVVLTDGENERVIYRDGDSIPVSSDELTAYYHACQGFSFTLVDETEAERDQRWAETQKLTETVPELN